MPIYEYQCDQCQTRFEVRASFQEKDRGLILKCPKYNNEHVHQILGLGVIISEKSKDGAPQSSSCCGSGPWSGSC